MIEGPPQVEEKPVQITSMTISIANTSIMM